MHIANKFPSHSIHHKNVMCLEHEIGKQSTAAADLCWNWVLAHVKEPIAYNYAYIKPVLGIMSGKATIL